MVVEPWRRLWHGLARMDGASPYCATLLVAALQTAWAELMVVEPWRRLWLGNSACRSAPNRLGRIDGGGTVEAPVAWATLLAP